MATFVLTIREAQKNANGECNIKIRITHKRKVAYIGTQFYVKPTEWNNGKVVKRTDKEFINSQLRKLMNTYISRYNDVDYADDIPCDQLIRLIRDGRDEQHMTFESIAEEYISTMDEDRHKTITLYRLAVRHFTDYCGKDFILSTLTAVRVNSYIQHLKKKKLSSTTINMYITMLKVIINYAKKMQYVSFRVDPFVTANVPTAKKRDTAITPEELMAIRDAEIDKYNVRTCRDVFMLTYYLAGMNLVDMLAYDFRGKTTIDYIRKKTMNTKNGENRVRFTIPDEAVPLIKKYMNKNTGRLVFGKYSCYVSMYNVLARKIKDVGELAGVSHYFTLYSARKSFVQHGFDLGIPLSTLEYCIGQTMKEDRPIFNYVNIMQRHADAAIRKILDSISQ